MLTKSKHYFFDAEAVKEPGTEEPDTFRNIRNIWTMPTQAYPGSHFATFPEELPRKCILAGTSEKGCCPKCGAQYERIVERNGIRDWQNDEIVPKGIPGESIGPGTNKRGQANRPVVPKGKTYDAEMQGSGTSIKGHSGNFKCDGSPISPETKTIGWKPTCDCHGFDPVPCTVLDIFAGSGTTLKVALELNRRAIGIELNPDYIKQIKSRIMKEATQEKFVI